MNVGGAQDDPQRPMAITRSPFNGGGVGVSGSHAGRRIKNNNPPPPPLEPPVNPTAFLFLAPFKVEGDERMTKKREIGCGTTNQLRAATSLAEEFFLWKCQGSKG